MITSRPAEDQKIKPRPASPRHATPPCPDIQEGDRIARAYRSMIDEGRDKHKREVVTARAGRFDRSEKRIRALIRMANTSLANGAL